VRAGVAGQAGRQENGEGGDKSAAMLPRFHAAQARFAPGCCFLSCYAHARVPGQEAKTFRCRALQVREGHMRQKRHGAVGGAKKRRGSRRRGRCSWRSWQNQAGGAQRRTRWQNGRAAPRSELLVLSAPIAEGPRSAGAGRRWEFCHGAGVAAGFWQVVCGGAQAGRREGER